MALVLRPRVYFGEEGLTNGGKLGEQLWRQGDFNKLEAVDRYSTVAGGRVFCCIRIGSRTNTRCAEDEFT